MKEYLTSLFTRASSELDYLKDIDLIFDIPKLSNHGDLSSNAALLLTKKLRKNPRQIAQQIIDHLKIDEKMIYKVEIAGAGFINFFFTPFFLSQIIKEILQKTDSFGKTDKYRGLKANVEFVSANPTGPLTVGHGRNAVAGDTIANLLEWVGYTVDREYYFNNAGRQMRVLADSVKLRYLELCGVSVDFPEDHYRGEYIIEIAKKIFEKSGNSLIEKPDDPVFRNTAEAEIFSDIKNTLNRLGIRHSVFFNENSLYQESRIRKLLGEFERLELSYKKDDALWLKLSELGNQDDKVIVKASGEPTYRLPDIAYHITKFERGYDLIVDLFGSDHNATYPDVLAGLRALGYDTTKIKVLIHQFVTITENGEVVKMSTRKANFITLDELIDSVGSDVVRYFFNMRNLNSHMNFDLTLAKKQSDENPVFYLQYAHARICSILRNVKEQQINRQTDKLELLCTAEEKELLKKLHSFREEVIYAAENFETHRICTYLEELAAAFHKFYTYCRIIGSEKDLAGARLALAEATGIIIKNGLAILGVTAPERM